MKSSALLRYSYYVSFFIFCQIPEAFASLGDDNFKDELSELVRHPEALSKKSAIRKAPFDLSIAPRPRPRPEFEELYFTQEGETKLQSEIFYSRLIIGDGSHKTDVISCYDLTLLSDRPDAILIEDFSSLEGSCTLRGSLTNQGNLSIGFNEDLGIIKICGDVFFESDMDSSYLTMRVDGTQASLLDVDGVCRLSRLGAVKLHLAYLKNPPQGNQVYKILQAEHLDGVFPDLETPSHYGDIFSLDYTPTSVNLVAKFPTNFLSIYGNQAPTASLLNKIHNKCKEPTQHIIDSFCRESLYSQANHISQLAPDFKVVQYSLEKLDLLIHRELEKFLYQFESKNQLFITAGYDVLNQGSKNGYPGYNTNSYYQLLGYNHFSHGLNFMIGAGASESYLKMHPHTSKANFNTVYALAGLSGKTNRWECGLDAIYGYSFLKTTRSIDFLNQSAKSHHGAWEISAEGKISYAIFDRHNKLCVYETAGYLYGHENPYSESGALGADLKVKNEQISVFRNLLGLQIESPIEEKKFVLFGNLSWMYERFFGSPFYQAAFIGTDVWESFYQTVPEKNYGRLQVGFFGSGSRVDWTINYIGLYAKNFIENSGSIKLAYKF